MHGHVRMESVWAWVCTDKNDNTEGVPATNIPGTGLVTPMYGGKRSVVERMRPTAEELVRQGHTMQLVEFTARMTHETLTP